MLERGRRSVVGAPIYAYLEIYETGRDEPLSTPSLEDRSSIDQIRTVTSRGGFKLQPWFTLCVHEHEGDEGSERELLGSNANLMRHGCHTACNA